MQAKTLTTMKKDYRKINQESLAAIDYSKVDWQAEKLRHEQMHIALQKDS